MAGQSGGAGELGRFLLAILWGAAITPVAAAFFFFIMLLLFFTMGFQIGFINMYRVAFVMSICGSAFMWFVVPVDTTSGSLIGGVASFIALNVLLARRGRRRDAAQVRAVQAVPGHMVRWRYNPPPNWPPPPPGWTPSPDWRPRAEWPPPPPGWSFWTRV